MRLDEDIQSVAFTLEGTSLTSILPVPSDLSRVIADDQIDVESMGQKCVEVAERVGDFRETMGGVGSLAKCLCFRFVVGMNGDALQPGTSGGHEFGRCSADADAVNVAFRNSEARRQRHSFFESQAHTSGQSFGQGHIVSQCI